MNEVPNDIKGAMGQLFVLASVTSDPGMLLRVTRSFMSLTLACMAVKNGDLEAGKAELEDWDDYQDEIELITAEYGANGNVWPNVLNQCGRIADYFYAIGLINDFIEIDDGDFNITVANMSKRKEEDGDERNPDTKYLHGP